MRRARRSNASIVANPVLVGAVTTLVVVVAVFLAYNANNGLPFVPTRQLDVLVSNGANLVKGNEVRSGGFRIGVVTDMTPVMLPDGKVGAKLHLKLDKKAGAVPVDSKVVIRPRSALGLKYVELDNGRSKKIFADGATMPAKQASVPVEIDQFFNMFDEPTRRAAAGQPAGLRRRPRRPRRRPQPDDPGRARALRSPGVRHGQPLRPAHRARPPSSRSSADTVRTIAPVSNTNAHLFTTMANTFEALSRDPQALKDTIAKSPPTLRGRHPSLRVQRPFLEHTAALSRDLTRPADRAARRRCRRSTPRCASARRCSGARSRSTTTSRARSARWRTSSRRPPPSARCAA